MPRKKKEKKEKVVEYFDVSEDGKEKTIKAEGTETINVEAPEKQVKEENKMLRNILIALGVLVLLILAVIFIANNLSSFEHKGITFEVVKEIAPYKTSLPVKYQGSERMYNFYLRNDPRNLDYIPFVGELKFKPFVVLNATDELKCDGDGIIAIANVVNLYKVMGPDVIKDENASCSSSGEYMYLNIIEGNESKIEQYGESCYNLVVSNCEVLKVTERFMIETFAEVQDLI